MNTMKEFFRLISVNAAIWLEIVVFLTVCGSTPIIHAYMVKAGVPDSGWLWVAIIAVDFVIVGAAHWGIAGLTIALIITILNVMIILQLMPNLTPAIFTITAFLGTLANAVRLDMKARAHQRTVVRVTEKKPLEQNDTMFLPSGQLDPSKVKGLSASQLRDLFKLSHNRSRELANILNSGRTVTADWLQQKEARRPAPTNR